ncbi:hypothetical protein KUTeg_024907 [Tegillarca granosa]|uniref:Cytochrome P450 n=1 Tax=Tegillarca granosa TaxID=220873 RepID=A0ABQ9E3S4_TEGGR|nr:hypothetical protein KUTeg_024907 [Tegillarca granosa]
MCHINAIKTASKTVDILTLTMILDVLLSTGGLTAILILLLITLLWMDIRRPPDLPPGPPIYVPILGNLVGLNPETLLGKLKEYRKQYGDVFSLKMGSKWWIVLNGYDTIHAALVKNADVFSSRPDITIFRNIAKRKGIVASSGKLWKEQRTFALTKLRDFGFGKRNFESNILEEVEVLVKNLEEQKGNAFDIDDILYASISNVTCSIVFGKRFSHTDPTFRKIVNMFSENLRTANGAALATWMPFLRFLPFDMFNIKKVINNVDNIQKFLQTVIDDHWKTYDENNIRDFIDAFITEQKRREDDANSTFTDFQLFRVVFEFFIAGTETTSTTLRWAIIYLIRNPQIQEKMRKEIESVAGSSQFPRLQHRQDMPYTEAVLAEIQRCGDIVPLSLFHGVEQEVKFKGFRIPKEAVITPNLESVLLDPNDFTDPFTFNPERFLNQNGIFCHTEKMVAFSLGRRVCLGESLAKMELFLFLTAIVQRFNLLPKEENCPPSLEPIIGATRSPKPFKFKAQPIC